MSVNQQYNGVDLMGANKTGLFVAPPVMSGLLAYYEIGGTDIGAAARSILNQAYNGQQGATIVGAPTYEAGDLICLSNSNYLQTPIVEAASDTYILVTGGGITGTTANLGICGTYGNPNGNSGIVAAVTSATPPVQSVQRLVTTQPSGGGTTTLEQVSQNVPDLSIPRCIASSYDTASKTIAIYDLTSGTQTSKTGVAGNVKIAGSIGLRVGSGYNAVNGSSKVSAFAYYSRALAPAELQSMYAFMKIRAAKRGIAI